MAVYPAGNEAFLAPNVITPQHHNVFAGRTQDAAIDTAALQWAITQAIAAGNGTVYLGSGDYLVNDSIGELITSPISIIGDGQAQCRIVMDVGMSGDLLSFSNCWYGADETNLEGGGTGVGTGDVESWPSRTSRVSGVVLRGFSVVGSRATVQTQNGIVFYDRNDAVTMRDVDIHCIKGYGLVLSGIPSSPGTNAASVMRESHIENVHLRWCGDHTTARPAVVFNSTDKGALSFDDACNYCEIVNMKNMFSDGVGFQTNCFNLNSNSHSNNRIRVILDTPQNVSGASVSGSVASITNGVLTLGAGTFTGTFGLGQYINNASVPIGTYISSQLTGSAGGAGTYQLANRTLDVSTLTVASGGNMSTLRSNIPCMQIGGGHASESWDVVLNASNTLGSGACGIEFNHNVDHASTAKTVSSTLEVTNGNMDTAIIFTIINSLAVRWKLRGAVTAMTSLSITGSVTVDLLERAGTDPAIGGVVTNLHVRPGGQDVISAADFATMPASKFPNCVIWENNAGALTQKYSNGTAWSNV